MAITGNFRGTTQPRFQISKSGAKIFGTTQRPADNTGPNAPAEGDVWINQASNTLEVFKDNGWQSIGATLSELNVADGTLVVDAGNNTVTSSANVVVNGSVTANEFVGDISLANQTTDTLAEGIINKYFSDERAINALPGVDDVLYVNKNGIDTNNGKTEYTAFLTISEAFESIGDPYKATFPEGADLLAGNKTNAADLLTLNKQFIQAEVMAYVEEVELAANPNLMDELQKLKCARDVGTIVDNLAQDLIRGGSQFSEESGLAYYNGAAKVFAANQTAPTTNAISLIGTISSSVLSQTLIPSGSLYQTSVTQQQDANKTAEDGSIDSVNTLITGINDTITSPTISRGADLRENFSLDAQLNPGNFTDASTLLSLNREFIQAEVIQYVTNTYPALLNDAQKSLCERDTGYIVDALAEDLIKGGHKRSARAALSYYNANTLEVPDDQVTPTTDAISYIDTLAADILTNTVITSPLQINVSQVANVSYTAESGSAANLSLLVTGITSTIDSPNVHQQVSVTANFPRDAGSNRGGFTAAATLLEKNRHFIQEEVIGFVAATESFQYDEVKCERDVGLIIDALGLDLALNTNYNSILCGIAYRRVSSKQVIENQYNATVAAIQYVESAINALGIDTASQTFISARIQDILNLFQNNIQNTIFYTTPGGSVTQDQIDAHQQLQNNRKLIQQAVVDYVNTNYAALVYDDLKCYRDVGFIVDALSFDILYGGNRSSLRVAESYFVGAASQLGSDSNEVFATIDAYTQLKSIVAQIIQETYTGQDTTAGPATATQASTLGTLLDITIDALIAGNITGLPAETLPDVSWVSTPTSTDYTTINNNKSTIQADTIVYINSNFTALLTAENEKRCKRDVGHIVDALVEDLINGGNEQSKKAAVYYYEGASSLLPQDQITPTVNAITYIGVIANRIIDNLAPSTSYQSTVSQYIDLSLTSENRAGVVITNMIGGITGTIQTAYPRRIIVKVAAGDYIIDNPIKMPPNSALFGEGLRTTSIRPYYTNQDMFYMNVGTYITGVTFRDHVAPSAAVAFNPALKDNLRPDITVSPYVQNCTSRTTTGTGMRIDGNAVRGNIRSMVVDSFTQFNEGGVGIHILNRGYAQLVSVFTICCADGFLCESGGTASITNSNSSFGTRALKSVGISELLYSGTTPANISSGKNFIVENLPARPRVSDVIKFSGVDQYFTVNTVTPIDTFSSNVSVIETFTANTAVTAGSTVEFFQRSLIVASSHTFEYVGAGNILASALPSNGGVPVPDGEGVEDDNNAGKVFFTATNERGDFSVSGQFIINQNTGTVSGRTFNKSLFAVMTPYILALQ